MGILLLVRTTRHVRLTDAGEQFAHDCRAVIVDYLRQHRQVRLRALLVDRVVRLLDEGVDVAVRIGRLPDSSLTAIHVGDVRRIVCAAPDFLARAGVPSHPDMLPRYCTVSVVMEGQMDRWRFVCDGHARDLDVQAQLTVTSSQAAVRAAVQGWGLAQVVSYQAAGALREGALQVVLREFEPPPLPVHVVYPEGRKGAAKVRSFVEFCVERLRAELGELPA
ncbi:LysR substrate-binding domain-containing protein [Bordetella pertussis]|uniref:LysR substrate-binding domain-containing protein n=1 Tax=Bordetella pertussis TaxID=520 RepID=UPI0009B269B2|nr:LysR substrate-binding domain-containing protein [Bordetella pertussis]